MQRLAIVRVSFAARAKTLSMASVGPWGGVDSPSVTSTSCAQGTASLPADLLVSAACWSLQRAGMHKSYFRLLLWARTVAELVWITQP